MGNYSLVIDSTFKPFTYQELMAPVAAMSEAHEKLATEYDKLSSQADILEAMGKNDRDKNSGVYNRYKAYSDRLRAEADELYAHGLNTESRQRLSDLRRMYNTEIVPIQNAWNKRDEEAKLQMKAQLDAASKGIDIRFSRDAANTPLGTYIDNPNQTFRTINGQQLTSEVGNIFKGLASQLQQDKNGNYWIGKKQINPIEYSIITQKGMDFNQYADFINNPYDERYSTIRGIIDNVLGAHGIQDFDAQTQRDMFQYAALGASAGVGARDMQIHEDKYAGKMLDYQKAIDLAKAKGEIGNEGDEMYFDAPTYQLPMMGADFSNGKEQEEAMKTLGYRMKDGKLHYNGKVAIKYDLNSDEVDAYNKQQRYKMDQLEHKIKVGNATGKEVAEYTSMQRMLGRYGNFKSSVSATDSKEVSLYDNKGNLMSREKFVAQAGNSEGAKKAFNEYYDKVKEASTTLGIGEGVYSHRDLTDYYNTLRSNSAAQFANVYPLNYEKGDWNTGSKDMKVKEIKGYKKGKPVLDSARISLNELLNKKDSEKNDVNVSAYWSESDGQEGLILATTEDNVPHRYFISADEIPHEYIQGARDQFTIANKHLAEADKYQESGNKESVKKSKKAAAQARQNALGLLHSGLTQHNKGYEQSIVRQPTLSQQGLVK